jgi:gliding motility-associated-like protein
MLNEYHKYIFLLMISLLCILKSNAQSGYGQPVYHQDFGTGNSNPLTIGIPLPTGKTDFSFSNSVCPPEGSYTILRRIPVLNCFNNEWIPLSHDNNTSFDYGMMMIVNNNSSTKNRLVYCDTVTKPLCAGEIYDFSVAIINLDPVEVVCASGADFPVFELRLEDETGKLIIKDTTRPGIRYASPTFGYKFTDFGMNFIMPGGVNKLILKLTLLHSIYWCGEDFAVDDFLIRPLGPAVAIGFKDEPVTTIVKSVCFQDNKTITLTGNMDVYYPNPSVQWQKSVDKGINWTDIPGATSTTYSSVFSTPDTIYFRLSGADKSNIVNPNCRVISNVIKVNVDNLPSDYSISSNSPVCSGQELKFTAKGGASYIWSGPNGFYDNISYPHIYHSSLKDSGMYYVDVFSLGGCRIKDSIYAKIIGTDVHVGPDTSICKGNSVQLNASKAAKYDWSPSIGLSNATVNNPVAKPGETTVYTVQVTDKDGCSDTGKVTVIILNKKEVKADISSNSFLCHPLDSLYFTSKSLGDIAKWNWDFGNGNTSFLEQPPFQHYNITIDRRSFSVRLTIIDTAGCSDTAYHKLTVVDNCYIAVPSAFTPNNDGLNDYLYPLNAYKATNLLFKVYNKYGKLIFETKDWLKKWDGKLAGIDQESDLYIWTLDYKTAEGNSISLKGTTLLIR